MPISHLELNLAFFISLVPIGAADIKNNNFKFTFLSIEMDNFIFIYTININNDDSAVGSICKCGCNICEQGKFGLFTIG